MKKMLSIVFATLLTVAVDAATFRLEYEGEQLPGGEVCLFDARSFDGPLERLTTFSSVHCVSADSDVPLPKGEWNLFARNLVGYVSRQTLFVRDGRVEGDRREIDLERAGRVRLEFDLAKSETAAIYVERSGVVFPLVPGEREVFVPASTPFFLLVMNDGAISRIGLETVVEAARVVSVLRPTTVDGTRDFAVGLVPDRGAFERIPADNRAPGRIELSSPDATPVPAANRVDPVFKGGEAIALFQRVPLAMGTGVVRVVGDGWSSAGGEFKAFRIEGPLRIAPTTSLSVRWSVVDDVVRLVEQLSHAPECPRAESSAPQTQDVPGVSDNGLSLTLARCPGLQAATAARSVRKGGCAQVASATLDESRLSGSETMNDVAPGVYLLRLGYGVLPPAFETIEVARIDADAAIELRYDRWFGKVTRDREPLFAQVGIGDGVTTDPGTGEYFAISIPVPPPPPAIADRMFKDPPPISVMGCDSDIDVMFAPDERPVPNLRFDIEIEPNNVAVKVIDAKTTRPVPGATLDFNVLRREHPDTVQFGGSFGKTDESGYGTLRDVPPGRVIELCASRDDYRKRCADRFVMKEVRERTVTIALEAANLRRGRVLHPAVGGGLVLWYRPDGRALESAEIAMDGTFTYKDAHAPGEVVSVVSAGAPLLVLRHPALRDDESFDIQFPAAPVRSFNLSLPPEAREVKGFVSLSVGDIVVPLNVLSRHLRPRGVRPLFLSPGLLAIPDIVASGPVSFIFAPLSWAEIYGTDQSIDYFYLPAAVALPRVPAGSGSNVVIGK